MKRNIQKIIKELTEYLEKSGFSEKPKTYKSIDGYEDAGYVNLAYSPSGENFAPESCASFSDYDGIRDELDGLLKSRGGGETLFDLVEKHLKEKGMKPSAAYRNAQISKQDFSRYVRPDAETIGRPMLFNLAIGLKLDCNETKKLLRSAGYGYNKKSKFDLIVMFCISKKLYNVTLVNMLLDEFNQPLLKQYKNSEK